MALKILTNTTSLLSLLPSHKAVNFVSKFTMPSTCSLLPFIEQWTDCNGHKYEYDVSQDTTRCHNFKLPAINTNSNTKYAQTCYRSNAVYYRKTYIFLQKYSVANWCATVRKLEHSAYTSIYHVSQNLEGGKKSKNMTVFHTVSSFSTHQIRFPIYDSTQKFRTRFSTMLCCFHSICPHGRDSDGNRQLHNTNTAWRAIWRIIRSVIWLTNYME